MPYNVVTKSPRAPTIAVPGSKGNTRPAPQKGGGGNKAAGSVEPTAANTPTVSVSPTGQVTTEHFQTAGPSPAAAQRVKRQAHAAAAEARRSRQRVQKVKSYVRQRDKELTPKREVKVSKDFLDKAASPKSVTVAAHARKLPGSEAPRAKPVKVETHQRKLPEPKLKGTPKERKLVRQQLKAAKKEVLKSGGDNTVTGQIGQVLKKTGYDKVAASGIVGNAVQESSLDPNAREPGTHNGGLWGFTAEPNSLSNLEEFAAATRRNPSNPKVQTRFLTQHVSPETKQALNAAKSPQEAAVIFQEGFEHPYAPTANTPRREQGAVEAFESGSLNSNPKALKNYRQAAVKAKKLGMKVGPALPDVQADPATHTIKVKADAGAGVKWAEAQINVQENSGKQLRWAAEEGLAQGAPWCANFVSNDLARRGFKASELPANPNYSGGEGGYETWGQEGKYATVVGTSEADLANAKPGDILTFSGEHTAYYVGNGEMISGNFSDEVMRTPVSDHANLSMIIRPKYKGGYITVKESTPLPGTTSATGTLTGSAAPAAVSVISSTNTAPEKPKNGKPVAGKRLTPFQELTKRVKKLQSLGVDVQLPGHESKAEAADKPGDSSLHKQLAELEKRYSIGAV